jgi:D-alanyl-D-alanine carboxypeptidase (penicillin-binding protein 5/6)
LILTGGLLLALVGTLVLTYAVAISASKDDKDAGASAEPTPTLPAIEATVESTQTPTPVPTPPPTPTTAPSPAAGITAESAYALDSQTGAALVALRADERRPMASLTKMVSALVVARAIDDGVVALDDPVLIEQSDVVDAEVFSHMGLIAGDTVTVEQLLDGMLIPSGNDAAKALARYVGSRLPGGGDDPGGAFVAAMNGVVADLGLHDTSFGNPDGEDDASNYSTAHDLAVIGSQVMRSALLAGIVSTPQVTLTSGGPEQRSYELFNTNQLLGQPGVDGVKTGTTAGAGACLVASVNLADGRNVVVVVLGSAPDPADQTGDPTDWPRFADARAILAQIDSSE